MKKTILLCFLSLIAGFSLFFMGYYYLGPVKEIRILESDLKTRCENAEGIYSVLYDDWRQEYVVVCRILAKELFRETFEK